MKKSEQVSAEEACGQIIGSVASRLSDLNLVNRMMDEYKAQHEGLGSMESTLSHGYPGLILLFSALDNAFPGQGWEDYTHQYVVETKNQIEKNGVGEISLFSGLAGLCFAISQASKGGERYQKLLNTLKYHLHTQFSSQVTQRLKEKLDLKLPSPMEWKDLIGGITGIGGYLLADSGDEQNFSLLKEILSMLVLRTQDIEVGGVDVPGWYTPSHYQFIDSDKELYPKGNFNMGMAHGVAGFAALFALALEKGISVPGQEEALKKICTWLIEKKRGEGDASHWIDRIAFEEEVDGKLTPAYFTADAWCYGSAGVCRALYLGGRAFGEARFVEEAHQGYIAILSREKENWNLPTYSFCHGYGGLLAMVGLMARDLDCPKLRDGVTLIQERLIAQYSEENPLGFVDVEPALRDDFILNTNKEGKPQFIETSKAGLLDGVSGIALSLLNSVTEESRWAQAFLIEGENNE